MPKQVEIPSFKACLKDVLAKYKNSEKDIIQDIEKSIHDPSIGDKYPGFPVDIYKIRLPIKKYNIGKSGGLRLIILRSNNHTSTLLIYYKQQFKEHEVIKRIAIAMKEFIEEIK